MTKNDLFGQFLVGASTVLVTAIINSAVPTKISWLWLIPAFLVPFMALAIYQGTGFSFRPYKEWRICEGELTARGGTKRDKVWEFEHRTQEGLGFYGPYIALPKGKFRAIFRLKIDKRDEQDEPAIDLDVTSDSGRKYFAHHTISIRDFKQADRWQNFPVDFNMINDESKVEFRGWVNDNVQRLKRRMTFDKVTVYKRVL